MVQDNRNRSADISLVMQAVGQARHSHSTWILRSLLLSLCILRPLCKNYVDLQMKGEEASLTWRPALSCWRRGKTAREPEVWCRSNGQRLRPVPARSRQSNSGLRREVETFRPVRTSDVSGGCFSSAEAFFRSVRWFSIPDLPRPKRAPRRRLEWEAAEKLATMPRNPKSGPALKIGSWFRTWRIRERTDNEKLLCICRVFSGELL